MKTTAIAALLVLLLPFSLLAAEGEDEAPAKNPVAVIKTSMGEIHVELLKKAAPVTVANFLDLAEGRKEVKLPGTDETVKKPFYDGLTFHRIIKGFMIQGGCPLGNGTGGPGYAFKDEINAKALGLDKMKVIQEKAPHPWLLIRSQADFQRQIVQPLFRAMGIKSQEDLDARRDEVQKALEGLTLEQAYENLGYEYDDTLPSVKMAKGTLAMANSGPNTNGKHTVFGRVIKGMDVVEAIGAVATDPRSGRPVTPVTIVSIREWKGEYPWDQLEQDHDEAGEDAARPEDDGDQHADGEHAEGESE